MVAHGNADVLHFREHFEAVLTASRPVPEDYAAKWLAQVTHVLGVDEHHASFNATRQA